MKVKIFCSFIIGIFACFNSSAMTEVTLQHDAMASIDAASDTLFATNGHGASGGRGSSPSPSSPTGGDGGAQSPFAFRAPSDQKRAQVTRATEHAVNEQLKGINYRFTVKVSERYLSAPNNIRFQDLPPLLKSWCQEIVFYSQADGTRRKDDEVLRRFDIMVIPAHMDFDANWDPFPSSAQTTVFDVINATALNIGETARAPDFQDYAVQRSRGLSHTLDERAYLKGMERIINNIFYVAQNRRVKELVATGFGMGAFIRKLPENDHAYKNPQKMLDLATEVAAIIMRVAGKNPGITFHLCLLQPRDRDIANEAYRNYLAFQKAPQPKNVQIHLDVDAAALAQGKANQLSRQGVALLNAANRHYIGNHWPNDKTAHRAQDENFYRRSHRAASCAYLINGVRGTRGSTREWIKNILNGREEYLPGPR